MVQILAPFLLLSALLGTGLSLSHVRRNFEAVKADVGLIHDSAFALTSAIKIFNGSEGQYDVGFEDMFRCRQQL
jgi:hypothetical protein